METLPFGAPSATPAPRPGEAFATSPVAEVFPAGTFLEQKYLVRYVLGHGSMGVVYLADDTMLKRKVAVKVLSQHYQRDADLVAKFQREAVAMAAVHHPNVVQIFTFGVLEGNSYFVMEYVEGETLANVIDRRREAGETTHLDEAVGIIGQVCKGLQAIHQAGIVHRDVKPANIMLSEDYRVAITDFGLVRPVESVKGKTLDMDGTPMYLAPERIKKTDIPEENAHLCDIYSLGAVFYELITGVAPFESESIVEVLDAHLRKDPPKPSDERPDLPSGIDRVVAKAMAKNPAARYQSCDEMHRALMGARSVSVAGIEAVEDQPRTFLVVEPDDGYRDTVCRALSLAYPDSTVLNAPDGQAGLAQIREGRPHVDEGRHP